MARATGVYIHHLTALEHGDHGDLPEDEIVAGYVRACAEHLELDAAALVAEFCSERGILEPPPPVEAGPEEPLPEEPAPQDDESPPPAEEAASEEPASAEPVIEEPAPAAAASPARGVPLPLLIAAVVLLVLLLAWWLSGDAEESSPSEPPVDTPVTRARPSEDAAAPVVTPPAVVTPLADAAPPPGDAREDESVERESSAAALPLTVSEHGVGTGVKNHRLVGEADSFAAGTKVWFWTRVRGGAPGQRVRHVWLHEGKVVEGITLTLGSSNWRTQSAKTLYSTGRWAVEARDADGAVLARTEFTSRPAR